MRVVWKYRSETTGVVCDILTDGVSIDFTPKGDRLLILGSGEIIHTHYRVWDLEERDWKVLNKNNIIESRTSFDDE